MITGGLETAIRDQRVHNREKWTERESDHKPLYNVETTSGAVILSLCMSVRGI